MKNTKQKVNGNLETYKHEVAEELGVNLGGKSSAKQNGSVGGEMTKQSVARGKQNTDTESLKYEVADECFQSVYQKQHKVQYELICQNLKIVFLL